MVNGFVNNLCNFVRNCVNVGNLFLFYVYKFVDKLFLFYVSVVFVCFFNKLYKI